MLSSNVKHELFSISSILNLISTYVFNLKKPLEGLERAMAKNDFELPLQLVWQLKVDFRLDMIPNLKFSPNLSRRRFWQKNLAQRHE
jgi:hypothetical protein